MRNLLIPIIFISLLFSCKKQDEINPYSNKMSFTVVIDEQDRQALDCRKLCYYVDGNKTKVDTLKFCNVGLNYFTVNCIANNSIDFFMSKKPENTIKITVLTNVSELSFKHVSSSVYYKEIAYTGVKYSK